MISTFLFWISGGSTWMAMAAAAIPVPVMYPLTEVVSYGDLCQDLANSSETVRWCQALKLLSSSRTCSCGIGMHLVQRKRCPEGMAWRCPRKGCRKVSPLRKGSFFEGSHLPIEVILRLIHMWSVKTPVGKVQDELEISSATAVDWYNFVRDICAEYFLAHPAVIGGPGIEVEIDESKFGKRKYNRGRVVDGHWVFGGIERGSGECFLVEVEKRDAATLLPLISQHVRPGSTVLSDEWSSYNQLTATTGNTHLTVNHSLHFVDPTTGAHTQSVEGMWSCCKRMMREEKVMNSALFETYLPEFMWRKRKDLEGP